MSRLSILKRSIRTAAAVFVLLGLVSPASANQSVAVSIFPDVTISGFADHADVKPSARRGSLALTSRRPWLAPVGHRQPQLADVPQSATVSAWEQQQQRFDHELDRKLIICRGC